MGRTRVRTLAALLQVAPLAPPFAAEGTTVRVVAPCPIEGTNVDSVLAILRAQLAPVAVEPSTPAVPSSSSTVEVTLDTCRKTGTELEVSVQYRGDRHSI